MCARSQPRAVRRERIPKAKCYSHIVESSFRCPPGVQAGLRVLRLMNPISPLVRPFLCEAFHYCWQNARFTPDRFRWFLVKHLLNICQLHFSLCRACMQPCYWQEPSVYAYCIKLLSNSQRRWMLYCNKASYLNLAEDLHMQNLFLVLKFRTSILIFKNI